MGKSRELSTSIVKAGHRVYFVDAKVDSRGNRYLALSECKSSPSGGARDRQRIHIYEEDLGKVFEALSDALRGLGYDLQLVPSRSYMAPEGEAGEGTPESLPDLEIPTLDDIFSAEEGEGEEPQDL